MAAGMFRFVKPLASAAALFTLYLALGFFAGPPLVKHILTHDVAESLKRVVSVGEVQVNPLALSVELKDIALAEADGAPIAGFRRIYANFQLSSLFRRAWTFSEISLEGPELRADIAPDGRFNLLALADDLPKSGARSGDRPPRVLLQHLALSAGKLSFSDRSLAPPANARLTPINLEVHDLSTIPDAQGNYAVSVTLPDGGTVSWRGEASLQPLASSGEIVIKGLKPLTPWRFIGYRLPDVAEPKGEFDAVARYRLSYAQGELQFSAEDLKASGRGIAVAAGGNQGAAIALDSFELSGLRAELSAAQGKPWQAKLSAPKIAVAGLDYTDRSRNPALQLTAKGATLGFSAALEPREEGTQVLLSGVDATVSEQTAGEPGASPHAVVNAVALEGGTVDLLERKLAMKRLAVTGAALTVKREQDGAVPLLRFLAPTDEGLIRRHVGGALQDAKKEGKPWRIAVDALQVEGASVAFSDMSFGETIAYDVRDLHASLQGYASDGQQPSKFDAALRIEPGGTLAASGEVSPAGDRVDLSAKLERLSLKPLAAALGRTQLALDSGEVSAAVKGSYRAAKGKPAGKPMVRVAGMVRLDNLAMRGRNSGEKLLGWKSLSASGVNFSLAPDALRVEEVKLAGVNAKIVVDKDRSVNLVKALSNADAAPARPQPAPAPAATAAENAEPAIPVTVERVRFEDGEVDFADLSLVLPFGAKIDQFDGLVQGISSDRASRAQVKLEGRVDQYGLARAEGSLNPFRPKSFLDLAVTFRNVEMPRLSPYSATFAGRRIDSGRLSLDLAYKINEGKLAGENRVLLEKFTLGEKVESPSALSLPLDLAVALLTDGDGKINLSVPVTGDVDDPQFGYGTLVWQAIRTVIGNIVSAPFRALASIFGGGGSEMLEAIAFDPGRAALLPPEQEKLKRVAEGLAKRPQIMLVAEGQFSAADRTALQRRDVALAVGAKLGRLPIAGADPDPVNVTDAKTQRALEAVFTERGSSEALDKFAADTGKARGKEVNRVNAALALFGRASADSAFYDALLKRLNETARVPDQALAQLASERAQAVAAHLTKALGVPAERAATRTAKATGEAQVKLELEIAPK